MSFTTSFMTVIIGAASLMPVISPTSRVWWNWVLIGTPLTASSREGALATLSTCSYEVQNHF
jgi:hypothetical protein